MNVSFKVHPGYQMMNLNINKHQLHSCLISVVVASVNITLILMELFNGEERTLGGYTNLAEAAGLKFVKF